MPDRTDEDDEWGLDSPVLPRFSTIDTLLHEPVASDQTKPQNAAFFKLPIELRNAIYRQIVISPLSRATNCRIHRPVYVDDAVFRIGYFKRDSVLPLLQTCHQMHVEASNILYGENVFIFHASSLANNPLPFFDRLPATYLRRLRRAYLLTEYFLPWPLQPSYHLDLVPGNVDEVDGNRSLERRDAILKIELEGSKMVARRALPPKSGFIVNFHDTTDMPATGTQDQLQRNLKAGDGDEWWSSSCQLWKMILIGSADSTCQQEFRRVVWTSTADDAQQPGGRFRVAGRHSVLDSDSRVM